MPTVNGTNAIGTTCLSRRNTGPRKCGVSFKP